MPNVSATLMAATIAATDRGPTATTTPVIAVQQKQPKPRQWTAATMGTT
jgi:hypothetical protein